MTLEANLFTALRGLVAGASGAEDRVYPEVGPSGVLKPYITYQQVGGAAINFLESAAVGKRQARVQVNCWADTAAAAKALARSAEDVLVASTTLRATIVSNFVSTFEEDTQLFGTSQDFLIWHV